MKLLSQYEKIQNGGDMNPNMAEPIAAFIMMIVEVITSIFKALFDKDNSNIPIA